MTDQPKSTQILDPQLEAIKYALEETLRDRDAKIRELKARNEYLEKALDALAGIQYGIDLDGGSIVHGWYDCYGDWHQEPIECPELLDYLCKRNGWPNPLEGGSDE